MQGAVKELLAPVDNKYSTEMYQPVPELCGQNCSVVIPAASNSNTPQMAVDLLIETLKPILIGSFHHEFLIPFADPSEFNGELDMTAASCEVYYEGKHHTAFLKMKGYVVPGFEPKFNEDICNWIKSWLPRKVLTLLSNTGNALTDKGLYGNPINPFAFDLEGVWNSGLTEDPNEYSGYGDVDSNMNVAHYGFDQNFYDFAHDKGLPSLGIMVFANKEKSEDEAILLAESVKNYLSLEINEWVKPISWGLEDGVNSPNIDFVLQSSCVAQI